MLWYKHALELIVCISRVVTITHSPQYIYIIIYVTVHAKTSLVRTKIKLKLIFKPSLYIATHISYLHSMSPMARLNWSAFLGVDLQPCKTMTDTLAPVERANWGVTSLKFYPRPPPTHPLVTLGLN